MHACPRSAQRGSTEPTLKDVAARLRPRMRAHPWPSWGACADCRRETLAEGATWLLSHARPFQAVPFCDKVAADLLWGMGGSTWHVRSIRAAKWWVAERTVCQRSGNFRHVASSGREKLCSQAQGLREPAATGVTSTAVSAREPLPVFGSDTGNGSVAAGRPSTYVWSTYCGCFCIVWGWWVEVVHRALGSVFCSGGSLTSRRDPLWGLSRKIVARLGPGRQPCGHGSCSETCIPLRERVCRQAHA